MPTLAKTYIRVDVASPQGRRLMLERRLGKNWRNVLARRGNVHPTYVSHVVAGRFRQPKIERLIARAVGFRHEDIWPNAA